jgi:hypothetical protein
MEDGSNSAANAQRQHVKRLADHHKLTPGEEELLLSALRRAVHRPTVRALGEIASEIKRKKEKASGELDLNAIHGIVSRHLDLDLGPAKVPFIDKIRNRNNKSGEGP